jgi:hypothetical protein
VLRCLSSLDLHPAGRRDIEVARALAAELIGPQVTSVDTFADVHAKTRASVFVYRQDGRITGTLGIVPLRPPGLDAICAGTFDPRRPAGELVCGPTDPFAALYGWGFAARTRKAAAAVVTGSMQLRATVFAAIPCFTRAATPAGARVILSRMGYSPYPGSSSGLLISPAISAFAGAA